MAGGGTWAGLTWMPSSSRLMHQYVSASTLRSTSSGTREMSAKAAEMTQHWAFSLSSAKHTDATQHQDQGERVRDLL